MRRLMYNEECQLSGLFVNESRWEYIYHHLSNIFDRKAELMYPCHKLNIYTDRYVDIVLLSPAHIAVYSLTSFTRIFILTVYGG